MTARREARRQVGLHTITTTTVPLSIEDLIKFTGDAAGGDVKIPGPPPAQRVKARLEAMVERIGRIQAAKPGQFSDAVREFADRCAVELTRARIALNVAPENKDTVAIALEVGMDLMDEWSSHEVNANLEKPMRGAIRTSEAGRTTSAKQAPKRKKAAEAKHAILGAEATRLNAGGNSRDDIIAKLLRFAHRRKIDVKPSSLEKIPAVRAHLPAKRRNRGP